jgi:hypothetical protein
MSGYECIATEGVPIKAWTAGVAVEAQARRQLENVAGLPFVHGHIAVMPDVHCWARPSAASSRARGRSCRRRSVSTSAAG